MPGNNDFYIKFGSNASSFGKKLEGDLAGAFTQLKELQKLVDGLGGGGGGRGPNLGTPGGGGGGAGMSKQQVSSMVDDYRRLHEGLDGVIEQMGEASKAVGAIARNAKAAETNLTKTFNARIQALESLFERLPSPGAAPHPRTPGPPAPPPVSGPSQPVRPSLGNVDPEIARAIATIGKTSAVPLHGQVASFDVKPVVEGLKTVDKTVKTGLDGIINALKGTLRIEGGGKSGDGKGGGSGGGSGGGGGGGGGVAAPAPPLAQIGDVLTIDAAAIPLPKNVGKKRAAQIAQKQKLATEATDRYFLALSNGIESDLSVLQAEMEAAARDYENSLLTKRQAKAKRKQDRATVRRVQQQGLDPFDPSTRATIRRDLETLGWSEGEKLGADRLDPMTAIKTRAGLPPTNPDSLSVADLIRIATSASKVGIVPLNKAGTKDLAIPSQAKNTTKARMLDIMQILVEGVQHLETDPEMRGKILPSGDNLRVRLTPSNMPKSLSRVVDQAVEAMVVSKAEETANELIRLNVQSGGSPMSTIGSSRGENKSVGARKGMPVFGSAFGGDRDIQALEAYRTAREAQSARGMRLRDTVFGMLMSPQVDFHDPDMQAYRRLSSTTGNDQTAKDRARAIGISSRLQAEFDTLVTTILAHEENVARLAASLEEMRGSGARASKIAKAERDYERALEAQAKFLGKLDDASGLTELLERRKSVGQELKAERRGNNDPRRVALLSKELSEIGEQIRLTPDIRRELSSPQARRAVAAREAAGNRPAYEASKMSPAEIREAKQDNGAYIKDAIMETLGGSYTVSGGRSKAVTAKLFPNVQVQNGRFVPIDMGGTGRGKLAASEYLIQEAIKSGALTDTVDEQGRTIPAHQRVNAAKIAREAATPAQLKEAQRRFEEAKASVPQVTDEDLKPFNRTVRAIASLEHERRRVMRDIQAANLVETVDEKGVKTSHQKPMTEGQQGVIDRINARGVELRTRMINQYEHATMRVQVGDEQEMLTQVQELLSRRKDLRKQKKSASSIEKAQINEELKDIQDTLSKLPRVSELKRKIARGGIDRLPTSDRVMTSPTTGEDYLAREWTAAIQQKAVQEEAARARAAKSKYTKTLQGYQDLGFNLEAIPQNINKGAVDKTILASLNKLYGTTAKSIDELVASLKETFDKAAKAIEDSESRVATITREEGKIVARNGADDVVGSLSFQRKGGAIVADEMNFAKGYASPQLKQDLLTRLRQVGFSDAPGSLKEIDRSLEIDTSRLVGRTSSGGLVDMGIPVGGRRPGETDEDYARRVKQYDAKSLDARLGKVDPAIVAAAHRLGVSPADVKAGDLTDPAALVNRAQIDALREPLARMGIRWSETFNEAIHAATTVDEVFAAIEKMGDSIKITAWTGPQSSYVAGAKPTSTDSRTAKVIGTSAEAEAKRDRALKTLDKENAKLQEFMAAAGQQGPTPLDNASDALDHHTQMQARLRRLQEAGRSGLTLEAEAEMTAIQAALGQWEIVARKAQALERLAKRGSGIAGKPASLAQSASGEEADALRAQIEERVNLNARKKALQEANRTASDVDKATNRAEIKQIDERLKALPHLDVMRKQLTEIGKAQAPEAGPAAPPIPTELLTQRHVVNSLEATQRAHVRAAALDQYATAMEENQKKIRSGGTAEPISPALYAAAAGRYKLEDGTLSNPSKAFTRLASSGDVTAIRKIAEEERQKLIASGRDDLVAIEKALAEERSKLAAMEKEYAAVSAAGAGGKGGKGTGSGGGFDECCTRIVEAINKIVTILDHGIVLKHTREEKAKPEAAVDSAVSSANSRSGLSSTAAGRASAIAAIKSDDVRNQVLAIKDEQSALEAGTRLAVEQGLARKKALEIVAGQAGITGKAVKDLDDKLKGAIADAELAKSVVSGGDAAARRAANQELVRQRSERKAASVQDKSAAVLANPGITQEAQREVAALKALDFAKLDAATQNMHLAATYRALMQSMMEMSAAERRNNIKNVFNAAGAPVTGKEMLNIAQMAGDVNASARQSGGEIGTGMAGGVMSSFEAAMFGNHGFWSRVMHSTGTFLVRNFTAGFVFGLTNALQDIVRQGIETESVFVRISNALESTGRTAGSLRTDLVRISTDYGVSLENVYKTAAGLTGMFSNVDDISAATRIITQLDMISGGALSAGEGIGALSSVTSAYGVSGAGDLQHVADVLTVIQNRLGTNIEVTAEGLGRIAGLAKQLGLPLEDAATYIGAIAKLTNQTGSAAGEQFQRIIAVMQSGRGQQALIKNLQGTGIENALAPNESGMRDYNTAIKILLANYSGLTQAQRENITVTLGGQRQAAALNALLEQGGKVLETARAAHLANGEAEERAQKISEQLNTQILKMQANFTSLGAAVVRTGLLNFFQVLLQVLNLTVGTVVTVLSAVNDFADSNQFFAMLRGLIGFTVGASIAATIATKAYNGLGAALAFAANNAKSLLGAQVGLTGTQVASDVAAASPLWITGPSGAKIYNGPAGAPAPAPVPVVSPWQQAAKGLENKGTDIATKAETIAARSAAAESAIATKALMAQGLATQVLASTATLTSKSMLGLSAALAAFRAASIATQGAILGGAVVVALLVTNLVSEMNARSNVQKAYEASFTKEGRNAADAAKKAEQQKPYVGPATDAWNARKEDQAQTISQSNFSMGLMGIAYAMNNPLGFAAAVISGNPDSELGRNVRAQSGDYSFTKYAQGAAVTGKYQQSLDAFNKKSHTVSDIEQMRESLYANIDAEAKIINSDNELTTQQKEHALADLESARASLSAGFQASYAMAHGLRAVDILLIDQINKMDEFTSSMSTVTTSGGLDMSQWSDGLMSIINEIGLTTQSSIKSLLVDMSSGSMNTSAFMRSQLEILKQETTSALSDWEEALKSGAEEQEIDKARQMFLNKVAQVAQMEQSIADAEVKAIADRAKLAARQDQTKLSYADTTQSYLQQELNRLKVREAEMRAAPKKQMAATQAEIDSVQSQIDALSSGEAQQQVPHAARASQKENEEALTNLEAQRKDLEKQLADLKAHPNGNEEAINQNMLAQAGILDEMVQNSKAVLDATYAVQRARTRNPLEQANIDLDKAKKHLAFVSGQPGMSWAVIQQAQADVITAQYAADDAKFSVQQAKRQTGILRVAPGDTIAAAKKSLADAKKTVANAKKYRGTSDEGDARYEQAVQAQIRAQRVLDDAIRNRATAVANYAVALAQSKNDAVAVAQASLNASQVALAQALEKSGGKETADVINARASVVAAQAQLRNSIQAVISSQSDLAVAVATAAGHTVKAAQLQLQEARRKLSALQAQGAGKAEINAAKASVVQADAAARDAVFNDQMGTIDFNLQMERMTKSSAISALENILKTSKLTRDERRQVLLRIKGLRDEIAGDAQWNIGDIKMPTPYEMRAYVKRNAAARMQNETYQGGPNGAGYGAMGTWFNGRAKGGDGAAVVSAAPIDNSQTLTIYIDGADIGMVKEVLRKEYGDQVIRTAGTTHGKG